MHENEWQAHVLKRLDAVLLTLLESAAGHPLSATRRIERLMDLGFSKSEVATIIGRPVNYVTAMTPKRASQPRKDQPRKGARS